LTSRDPVALDRVAWDMIDAQRQVMGLKTLAADQREPTWIAAAAANGLGEDRLEHIKLVDV
jgi:uncharacterized Fe-S center protein